MKNNSIKNRSFRKAWSSTSIADEVSYIKTTKKPHPLVKPLRLDFFPIENKYNYKHHKPIFIINPDSIIKIYWDVLLLLCLMLRLYIIPYDLSFSIEKLIKDKNELLFTDLVFILDIILKFNTGFHLKGFLITARVEIIKNYVKSTFLLDFVGSVPFQVLIKDDFLVYSGEIFGIDSFKYILLIKFVGFYRMKVIFYELEDRYTSIHMVTVLRFLHFSILISLLIHWSSCLSHVLYLRELYEVGELWTSFIEDEAFRYLNFLYYILFTVTSIGYYSLNIATSDQRVLTILIMCVDIIIFAYILGKIQSTLNSYQQSSNKSQFVLKKCKGFISQNKIPSSLRHKILRYLTFCQELERKSYNQENDIFHNLSLPLRQEIFSQTRNFILSKNPVFKIYQKSFLKFIGYHLSLQIFGPKDSIFEQGENSSIVYFIQNGQVEIFHSQTTTTFKILKKNRSFGEIGFFLQTTRTASAKSVTFTELLVLERNIFNKILLSRPIEKSLTEALIEETMNQGLAILHIRCYLCHDLGHVAKDCQEYKFSIDLKGIIRRIDNSKFKYTKKVNLNEGYMFTFQRSEAYSRREFSVENVRGLPFNIRMSYKTKPNLMRKCFRYQMRTQICVQRKMSKKVSMIHNSQSSSDELDSSPLPLNMQYKNAFLKHSINRREKTDKYSELNSPEGFPIICISKPPE
ncbi:hypothetical protein SteCoe_19946 [Stentor coeruleus]|uniref:Cyclic nucleotide-binding domain-containing protein n=1 Tax=Stentor coeruleus TaxID=5963 RepID=A0A1R2BT41_9CILI|nr:hypothetical protein SteCoe_19946 [Stentor coeruleus]